MLPDALDRSTHAGQVAINLTDVHAGIMMGLMESADSCKRIARQMQTFLQRHL
jgi:hypothetical protein